MFNYEVCWLCEWREIDSDTWINAFDSSSVMNRDTCALILTGIWLILLLGWMPEDFLKNYCMENSEVHCRIQI